MVALEVTVLEPLMLVTTLVMMLTLGGDEGCEDEEAGVPLGDALVDPPALFRAEALDDEAEAPLDDD